MPEVSKRVIGVMSGTSADGVDAVVADFCENHSPPVTLLGSASLPMPTDLYHEILALNEPCPNELERSQVLGLGLSRLYATAAQAAVADSGVAISSVDACAVHGQSLRHQPHKGYSIQAVSLPLVAELLKLSVVGDFRNRDMACGGQGAPLACGFHDWYFAKRPCAVLNLGGFANITLLEEHRPAVGFDSGPANVLLDAWTRLHLGTAFDEEGQWAASGTCLDDLLARLQQHPFFALAPPKSTGRDDFHMRWLQSCVSSDMRPEDVQATLVALSVWSIRKSMEQCAVERVYVCGGGVRNTFLMQALAQAMQDLQWQTTDAAGIPAQWMEAIAFAWLGWRRLLAQPGNLPSVTGARAGRILGCCYL